MALALGVAAVGCGRTGTPAFEREADAGPRPVLGCAVPEAGEPLAIAVSACPGEWSGPVRGSEAAALCRPGWHVCTSADVAVTRQITFEQARAVPGCYAFDAAHDSDSCRDCTGLIDHDDLAGVGAGCPGHVEAEVESCISGGRIDVSCCHDHQTDVQCSAVPGVTTGVLCCAD